MLPSTTDKMPVPFFMNNQKQNSTSNTTGYPSYEVCIDITNVRRSSYYFVSNNGGNAVWYEKNTHSCGLH